MTLQGKTVLVPGAARPIGRAIARRFALAGANLILPYYDWPESVDEMIKEFQKKGIPFHAGECDLRDDQEVAQFFAQFLARFSSLDILVNNIERGGMPVVHGSYAHEHNKGQWDIELETTLKAKWLLYTHAFPLLQRSSSAAVVNLSSIAACTGRSGPAAAFFNDGYSAANRGIRTFTETWAREGAPTIRVNELMLGLIESRHGENTRGWDVLTKKQQNALTGHTLLARRGLPEEVADAVFFLGVEAKYMTGSVLRMDGGYLLGGEDVPHMPPGIL